MFLSKETQVSLSCFQSALHTPWRSLLWRTRHWNGVSFISSSWGLSPGATPSSMPRCVVQLGFAMAVPQFPCCRAEIMAWLRWMEHSSLSGWRAAGDFITGQSKVLRNCLVLGHCHVSHFVLKAFQLPNGHCSSKGSLGTLCPLPKSVSSPQSCH